MDYKEAMSLLKLHLPPPPEPFCAQRRHELIDVPFMDLEEMTSAFGVGWINGYLKVYSPFAKDREWNARKETEEFKEIVESLREREHRARLISKLLHDPLHRCAVWAGSINGETVLVEGEENSRVSQRIVIVSADMDVVAYWSNLAEFLFNLVCGKVKGEFFSSGFRPPFAFQTEQLGG